MGSSGASKAAKEAQRQEDLRRAQIIATQKKIESVFNSPQRESDIQDFIGSQRGLLQSDLDRKKQDQDRQLKFATARSGLSGGSVDVDQNRNLSELYLRGVVEAERQAQNSGATLRGEDQAAKHSLFAQVQGGLDATTAAQNAAQSMRTNASLAKTNANFNAFDTLFGGLGSYYKNSREDAGVRRANKYDFGTLFGPLPKNNVSVAGSNPYQMQTGPG